MKKVLNFLKRNIAIHMVVGAWLGVMGAVYVIYSNAEVSSGLSAGSVAISKTNMSEVPEATLQSALDYLYEKASRCSEEYFSLENSVMMSLLNSGMILDGTYDNNLRFVGASPNNYVTFNGEMAGWRIIGIFNNIDDGTGTTETRIKLVRTMVLRETMNWDDNNQTNWETSTLQQYLNGNTSGNYYYSLTPEGKNMIEDAVWNLGVNDFGNLTASQFYTVERGNSVKSGNPIELTAKIGLIYPSDFGYAVGDDNCYVNTLFYNSSNGYNLGCGLATRNWLNIGSDYWTINPGKSYAVKFVSSGGYINGSNGSGHSGGVLPALYLKSSVKITGGKGTTTEPYTLG